MKTKEHDIVEKSIEQLFGDAVLLRAEQLPNGTHGLRSLLPASDSGTSERFNLRVEAWRKAAEFVRNSDQKGARYVLICASDREQARTEDQVNYYAGIHAMCQIADANVYHVPPVGTGDQFNAQQNLLHRLQSVLLDAFFAHPGAVSGTEALITQLFAGRAPKYVYGVQALRSIARCYSGELNVGLLLFTRVHVENGKTQVKYVYRKRHKTEAAPWREFSADLRWLGSQRELQSDEMWLRQSSGEQVRMFLGDIAQDDPRALVLIDWYSMRSLWCGISAEDFTFGNGAPTIGGHNITSICPGMTLVRLRRDGRALSLRTRTTYLFERLREDTDFTERNAGESYSDSCATTIERILAVMTQTGDSDAVSAAHYIQTMNYRKTVQIVRKQSCYRSTERMQKRKDAKNVFELRLVDPPCQDATLPVPLEVTVMSAQKEVPPDNVANAVLKMRFGNVHCGEWTSPPVPLFFKRKIEDYVIRYRSPASIESDEPLDAASDALDIAARELATTSTPEPPATTIDTAYALNAAGIVTADTGMTALNANKEIKQRGANSENDVIEVDELLVTLSEEELEIEEHAADEALVELARRAARSDIALCGYDGRARRSLYRRMLRGIFRVRVGLPPFVTPAAFWGPSAGPAERRILKRFWRDQEDFGFLKHGDPKPPAARFPEWLYRRLHMPQGGYSLHSTPLLFPGSIFYAVREGWRRYVDEQRGTESEGAEELSVGSIQLGRLTQWAVDNSDDELTAWLIFSSAHLPSKEVLRQTIENVRTPLGPMTRDALLYFIASARAARRLLAIKPGSGPMTVNFAPSYKVGHKEAVTGAPAVESKDAQSQLTHADVASTRPAPASTEVEAPESLVLDTSRRMHVAAGTLSDFAARLTPGQEDFPSAVEVLRQDLERLERDHDQLIRARNEEAEKLAAQLRAQAALEEEWARLQDSAQTLLERMRIDLPDTEPLSVEVRIDHTRTPAEVQRDIEEVTGAITGAVNAQREYQTVVERATAPPRLTPAARGRHQREWQDAVDSALHTFESALNALCDRLRAASTAFTFGDTTEIFTNESHPVEAAGGSQPATGVGAESRTVASRIVPTELEKSESGEGTDKTRQGSQPQMIKLTAIEPRTGTASDGEDAPENKVLEGEARQLETRATTLRQLLDVRILGIADLYAEVCDVVERSSAPHDDHGLLTRAALESIQSLRAEIPLERRQVQTLSRRLEENSIRVTGSETFHVGLALIAAGLHEMLFPPRTDSARWTFIEKLRPRVSSAPPLSRLIRRLEGLEGFHFTRDMLTMTSIGEPTEVHGALSRMRQRAKLWAQDPSLYTNWTKWDYRQLHEKIFKDSPIAECINCIARGEDQKAEGIFHEARKLLEKPTKTIDDLSNHCNRRRSFHGAGRDHARLNLERTLQFINEYFEIANRSKGLAASISGNARDAVDALYREVSSSLQWLDELTSNTGRPEVYRRLAILALSTLRSLIHSESFEPVLGSDFALMLQVAQGRDLKPSIYPLKDQDGIAVPPVVEPVEVIAEIEDLARKMQAASPTCYSSEWVRAQLELAAQHHDAHGRLLPLKAIDKRLSRNESRSAEQLKRARLLSGELQRERHKVTHAMAFGALTQAEASRMLRVIGELLEHAKSSTLSDLDSAPETCPDFPHAYAALRRLVAVPLEVKVGNSRKEFFLELRQYQTQSAEGMQQTPEIDRIRKSSEGSVSNLRAARDMFSLLKENALPPRRLLSTTKSVADEYRRFITKLKSDVHSHLTQVKTLIARLRGNAHPEDPQCIRALTETDRAKTIAVLEAWLRLCEVRSGDDAERRLKEFFRELAAIEPVVRIERQVRQSGRVDFSLEKPFAGLDRHVVKAFIPPSLGSRAPYLHGVIFGTKPTDAMIAQAIEERGPGAHTFIFCQGALTLERRAALSRHHPVILFDDDLVMFAALHPEARLGALLRVALLTYHDNPYDDYGTSPVPPEMFFGRLEQRQNLANVKVAAVLFGGRRLGKSSLLDQLRREARPGAETVLYVPLDRGAHDMSADYESIGWSAIRRAMTHAGLLPRSKKEPATARDTRRLIETEIMTGHVKAKRIYLLIDEADELMGHDLARKGTPFISSLVNVSELVRERCAIRFVIAGLHNLTRMAADGNSALGKFDAIALKPFWSAEDIKRGTDLIRVPLEALGYYFALGKEDMPLRIMAVCNFYPAFIQLYCKRLLRHLQNRRDRKEPPTFINETDLDAVEYERDFIKDIQGKFKLNLALDNRYAAIALVLADQYYREGAKSLTVNELRELCELWAPRHFSTIARTGYEALLEEMEILTILERSPGGRYGLRTPNVAMMIGDRESVEQRLDSLQHETPVQTRSRGEIRMEVNPAKKENRERPLFPMPAAWVRSAFNGRCPEGTTAAENPGGRLRILVGNDLSGLGALGHLKGQAQLANTATVDVGYYSSPHAARAALARSARLPTFKALRGRRLQCIAPGAWKVSDIPEYARLAETLAQRPPGTSPNTPTTRLALIATPEHSYELAQRLVTGEIENCQVNPVVQWSDDALYYYLESTGKPELGYSSAAREALLNASCGFGAEIERLCGSRRTVDDALQVWADAERHLAPDLQTFYRHIGMPRALSTESLKQIESLLRVLDGGQIRNAAETREYCNICEISDATFIFVCWMGLLQQAPGGSWHVPSLYKRLLQ